MKIILLIQAKIKSNVLDMFFSLVHFDQLEGLDYFHAYKLTVKIYSL